MCVCPLHVGLGYCVCRGCKDVVCDRPQGDGLNASVDMIQGRGAGMPEEYILHAWVGRVCEIRVCAMQGGHVWMLVSLSRVCGSVQ